MLSVIEQFCFIYLFIFSKGITVVLSWFILLMAVFVRFCILYLFVVTAAAVGCAIFVCLFVCYVVSCWGSFGCCFVLD